MIKDKSYPSILSSMQLILFVVAVTVFCFLFLLYVCACMQVQSLQRREEGVGSLRTGVTDGC